MCGCCPRVIILSHTLIHTHRHTHTRSRVDPQSAMEMKVRGHCWLNICTAGSSHLSPEPPFKKLRASRIRPIVAASEVPLDPLPWTKNLWPARIDDTLSKLYIYIIFSCLLCWHFIRYFFLGVIFKNIIWKKIRLCISFWEVCDGWKYEMRLSNEYNLFILTH